MSLYALKTPSKEIWWFTLGASKHECWGNSFNSVASVLGIQWEERHWKRFDASRKSAAKNGYRIVPVKLVEVRRSTREERE